MKTSMKKNVILHHNISKAFNKASFKMSLDVRRLLGERETEVFCLFGPVNGTLAVPPNALSACHQPETTGAAAYSAQFSVFIMFFTLQPDCTASRRINDPRRTPAHQQARVTSVCSVFDESETHRVDQQLAACLIASWRGFNGVTMVASHHSSRTVRHVVIHVVWLRVKSRAHQGPLQPT